MGLVSRQAYLNTINIFIGVVVGAINTIIVLPHAFENSAEDWGLVRTLLAYGIILAQVFGFGTFNIIVREYNHYKESLLKNALLGFSLFLGVLGLGILIAIFYLFKTGVATLIDQSDFTLIYNNLDFLIIISGALIFSQTFTGFIAAKHKTPLIQFVNEIFLKSSYLVLAFFYWMRPFSFELYLQLFLATYVISLIIYLVYSLKLGFLINFKFHLLKVKELLVYGAYTILDKGAYIIVTNLDLIMIGLILDLENVAYYVLAFYIGSVISIPQKAITAPAIPLVSSFIKSDNTLELKKLYKQTSLNQLIAGGILFVIIWSNIDAIYQLIPSKFSGGMWVVFYVALSKLFTMASGISGAMILFSKHYKVNLIFNVFLILITLVSNYFLIIKFGINGAAMATAITFLVYNILKVFYVNYRFKMQPFTLETIKSVLILLLVGIIGSKMNFFLEYPILSIMLNSSLVAILIAIGFYGLKVKAEILDFPKKFLKF